MQINILLCKNVNDEKANKKQLIDDNKNRIELI